MFITASCTVLLDSQLRTATSAEAELARHKREAAQRRAQVISSLSALIGLHSLMH